MIGPLLCIAAVSAGRIDATPAIFIAQAVRAEYQSRKSHTGRDAEGQTRLALWCEAHGLAAERGEHMANAVAADPNHLLARGLLGQVQVEGRWQPAREVQPRAADALKAEYLRRREALGARTAAATLRAANRPGDDAAERYQGTTRQALVEKHAAAERLALGVWCIKAGLRDEAVAEFTSAVHLDRQLDDAWRRLGYVKRNGRWLNQEAASLELAAERAQREGDKKWSPVLKRIKADLESKARRAEAETRLLEIRDPYAVAPLIRNLSGAPANERLAIRVLASIDSVAASEAIARLAVFGADDSVRNSAVDALKARPARDYGGLLVDMIRTPATYEFVPVVAPGSVGYLQLDTPNYQLIRTYEAPPAFSLGDNFYGYVGYDGNGLPIAIRGRELRMLESTQSMPMPTGRVPSPRVAPDPSIYRENLIRQIEARTAGLLLAANAKAEATRAQMVDDVRTLEAANAARVKLNAQASNVLFQTLNAPDLKDDQTAWHEWWYDRVGYRYTPPRKLYFKQTMPYEEPPYIRSCFAAGTPVRTADGPRPIELVRPGDRVLAQDVVTGALEFRAVLATHHNPPDKTIKIGLEGGETLVPSTYHRFWVAGKGWVIARDLKVGDVLRSLGGRARVVSLAAGEVVPVFNLDVDRSHTYFVGALDLLVHDNTLPDDRMEATPFDAPSTFDQIARRP